MRPHKRYGWPPGLPHSARAGVAAGVVLTCLAAASSPALAVSVRSQEWWLRTLHVTGAWRSTKGAGVTVAVLDTGVDPKQADLTGSVITGPDYTHSGRTAGGPYWGVHGTAMASIIAGHGHGTGDAYGIAGVAPAARILSVRVTLESDDPLLSDPAIVGGLPTAIARGIRYAVRQHAGVIDLPLDPVATSGVAVAGGSGAERAAVAYALARHVVLVAPAGDEGSGTDAVNYPAAYPGVISVGAFNQQFIKAPYSSHQAYVTLTAAGDGVLAASGTTGYAQVSSTSAASAVVAGIAALIRAQFPKLTPAQVRRVLTTSTVYRPRGGRSDGSGYGTVDAAAALMSASNLVEAVPSAAASTGAVAAQAPPSVPVVHATVIRKNLGHNLITDAGAAVALFLVLLGCILGYTTWRRRRARAARLAEVRAATQVPARKTRKPDTSRAGIPEAAVPEAAVPGAAVPGAAVPGAGLAGAGVSGAAMSGAGPSGTGFTGAGLSGTWRPVPAGTQDGHPPGVPGRATPQPQVEPVGFIPAPLAPGADMPGFTPEGDPSDPAPASTAPPGAASRDATAAGAPPWAPVHEDPSARVRGPGSAAIPQSAFAAAVADTGTEPASATEPAGGTGPADSDRTGGRPAEGSQRANPVRAPKVSGSPPWEPAPRPDSELPWAQAPTPPRGAAALPPRRPFRPETPTWDAIAEEVWPGGPRAAKPHPPVTPQPAGEQQLADRSSYAWDPGTADEPAPATPPGAGSGFLRGGRAVKAAQPPNRFGFLRGGRPATAAAPGSAGQAGAAPPGAGPGGGSPAPESPGQASTAPDRSGAASTGPAGAAADAGPAGAGQPDGQPADALPASPTPKSGIPPWEITDSFLAIRTEAPDPADSNGPSPAAQTPGDGASVPASNDPSSLLRDGPPVPTAPAERPSFPRRAPLPPSDETPSLFRRAPSLPTTPAEPPDSPHDDGPVPATPAETASPPGTATPADGTSDASESTETFPAVAQSGDGPLPRRIPLSERTGGIFPPPASSTDRDTFRLFPFGKSADPPAGENGEG